MKENKVLLAVEAVLLIIAGVVTLREPGASMLIFISLLQWILLIAGIVTIIGAFSFKGETGVRALKIIEGLLLVGLGILFMNSAVIVDAVVLVYSVMIWFMISALIHILIATKVLSGGIKWLSLILNILVVIITVYSFFDPLLATGIFIFALSFNFILLGINKVFLIFAK